MEILRYALGIRFDTEKFPYGDAMYHSFELICSCLSYAELSGITFHGGFPYDDEPNIYLVVLEADDFKVLKRVFALLDKSTCLHLFLADTLPFIEKNRLLDIRNMTPYGKYDSILFKLPNAPLSIYGVTPSKSQSSMQGKHFNFLFAPDSFKGTISSSEAIRLLTLAACETHYRGCNIISMPIADGGEGTLEAVCAALGGKYVYTKVHDPLGRLIDAKYAIISDTYALIEMAQASGLSLVSKEERDIRHSSSYGTGELIMHAINSGIRNITVALGGSATNDGGMGCANALGVKFLDSRDKEIPPCGDGLIFVRNIDTSYVPTAVRETNFTVMCDVENPLTGKNGATMVYGPQKGADEAALFDLECGMKNIRRYYNNLAGYDICKKQGAGAAGGMGAMLMAIFKAKLQRGIDSVLDLAGFDKKIKNVSLIVTGEGCLDAQTINGNKAVAGIIERTKGKVPIAILCGSAKSDAISSLSNQGVITLAHSYIDENSALENASALFYSAASNLFTLLNSGYSMKKK